MPAARKPAARKAAPKVQTVGIPPVGSKERRTLAERIAKARKAGQPYDGASGICNDPAFPEVRSAIVARKLLRELPEAKRAPIAKSYDRTAFGLAGPRDPATGRAIVAKPKRTRKAAPKAAPKPRSTRSK